MELSLTNIGFSAFLSDIDITLSHGGVTVVLQSQSVNGPNLANGQSITFNVASLFDGLDAAGTWTLSFFDDFFTNGGDDYSGVLTITTADVPLPASLPLLLASFGGLANMRRRKKA